MDAKFEKRHSIFPIAFQALILGILLFGLSTPSLEAQSQPSENTSSAYEYPFGRNPYLPSRALAQFENFVSPDAFPKASYCGECHQEVHKQWRQSAHANSFREPFYVKNVNLLIQQNGIAYTRHCEGCHNPIALFSGALTTGSKVDRSFDDEGVSCMVCHSIAKIQDAGGTGSYVMGVPAVMVKEDGTPIPGLASYDQILRRPDLHRRAVMRDFYRTAEFCAACHKAALPKQLNNYKWLRAFSVYDEWQQSAWAKQSPLPFYKKDKATTCQNCHMPQIDVQRNFGAKQGKVASHRWVGANTAIPAYYGYQEQLRLTEEFLKHAVTVDIFGLTKLDGQKQALIAPMERQKFSLSLPETVIFEVVVQNKGIGHSLVPEQRDFYEAWIEFRVSDATGRALFHSGYIKPDGMLDERAHTYTNRLISSGGKLLDHHQVWETRIRAYDNTIMPGRADLVRYQVRIPGDARGPFAVVARVNYRRFRRSYTNWVLDRSADFPIVKMAEQTTMLNPGINEGRAGSAGDDELFRWNNYGIALLEQQEYARAAEAFRRVIGNQPNYVDGHINIAIAELSEGKYEAALNSLQAALAIDPKNDRAAAYQGLVYRLQYKLDNAIVALKPVVAAYPRLRLARQELGYAYFLQKDYSSAREQYEALQSIDPDDLQAHRYLTAIYSKLGLKERAGEQAAYLADRADDPAAAYLVQQYWIMDPSLAIEVAPFHVHGEDPQRAQMIVNQLLKTSAIWPSHQ